MALSPGTKLGPYEVVSPLGAGGMGEVYLARDSRLDRNVAIKTLPSHLSSNPDLRARFEREAKAISALNHPHICTLHDVGNQNGIEFLVMELVEGETLDQRLQKGPLPANQILKLGMEIASALDSAHRSGLIHRDLKPSNIMLTKSGSKLMDFGLAKATGMLSGMSAMSGMSALATMTSPSSPVTSAGTIVGTFQYLSPEQVEGREADARSDLFAFGAVLYEMATGKRAFDGKSQFSVASAILEKEPEPISTLAPLTPPALIRVVQRCLAKDPEERLQNARDLMMELKWIESSGSQAGVPSVVRAHRKNRELLGWAIAGIASLGLIAAFAGYLSRAPKPRHPVRASILAPEKASIQAFDIALSPDGAKLAFVALGEFGKPQLWVRPLDSLAAQPLAGTDGASQPFWSPDGLNLGFFADNKLKRIEASGGAVQTLTEVSDARGGSWSSEGVIIFTPNTNSPIFRISAAGGSPTPATKLENTTENSHRWPSFLPDGRHFIYLVRGTGTSGSTRTTEEKSGNKIFVGSLDSDERTFVVNTDRRAAYAEPGYLLFTRGTNLMAQKFDAAGKKVTGDPVPVAEQIGMDTRWNVAFTVSATGRMVYQASLLSGSVLSWYDRTGKRGDVIGKEFFNVPRLSPDNKHLASSIIETSGGTQDIWLFDLVRGTKTRFTFDPADDDDPVWSPDGRTIIFDSSRKGVFQLYKKSADGSHPEELIFEDASTKYATSWSPDGKYVIFDRLDSTGKTKTDVWALSLVGDHKAFPVVATGFDEQSGKFSPDSKWVAYSSNESGRDEIYVVAFPNPAGRFQVSSGGGTTPQWNSNGKEIFFLDTESRIIAVDISSKSDSLEIGAPHVLMQGRFGARSYPFEISADGKRILANELPDTASTGLTLVLDWEAALKK